MVTHPSEVPAGADQHLAGNTWRVLLAHLVNPGVPRSVSYAKYAAAFFCYVMPHPQTGQLHLFGRDHHRLVPCAAEHAFGTLANPVTQAGFGNTQYLGRDRTMG